MRFPATLWRKRRPCVVCDDEGLLFASYIFARAPVCDCGAFKYQVTPSRTEAALILHAPECDSVPCPFCQLR